MDESMRNNNNQWQTATVSLAKLAGTVLNVQRYVTTFTSLTTRTA